LWEDRLSELADFRKIHGHCNVPFKYSENGKLGAWVRYQRRQYKLHLRGKSSFMSLSRIQELESLGFEWKPSIGQEKGTPKKPILNDDAKHVRDDDSDASSTEEALTYQGGDWAKKLKELCDYRQSNGQCIFRSQDPEYAELSNWVVSQRREYRRMIDGKSSILTPGRVKTLEGIGFVWNPSRPSWEERLSELGDYREIHGHCNVSKDYNENTMLANWVRNQRKHYKLHLQGKKSIMTLSRIKGLERLDFEWDSRVTVWEDRMRELANFRRIHGHCNVPHNYSESIKLGQWVRNQRSAYKFQLEGKKSGACMTLSRIQELESLGFEWKASTSRRQGPLKKPNPRR
jgi:hypothetical protein